MLVSHMLMRASIRNDLDEVFAQSVQRGQAGEAAAQPRQLRRVELEHAHRVHLPYLEGDCDM